MQTIRARAPVRILDIGGWTDTWFVQSGAVLNFAVDLFTHVTVRSQPPQRQRQNISGYQVTVEILNLALTIKAGDMGKTVESRVDQIEYDGELDLLKAAVKRLGIQAGIEVSVWADAPPAAGVGTSASVGVAMVAALDLFRGARLASHQIAATAQELETVELGLQCGLQDQFAAAFGGISLMEFQYPRVQISPVQISPRFAAELDERILVVYLGGRLSSDAHLKVIEGYHDGHAEVSEAIAGLAQLPFAMHEAILMESVSIMASVARKNWAYQKTLHSEMASPLMEEVERVAIKHGALAVKANGAGFGGSATVICDIGKEFSIKDAIARIEGVRILPCHLHFGGVESWKVPDQ